MTALIVTLLVAAIILLLIGVAFVATQISDAIARKVEARIHEHDHEMISGRIP